MVATKPVDTSPNSNKRRTGGFNGTPNRQRFKPGGGPKHLNARNMGAMFNTNQLGDNPGFVDFNDDVQIPSASPAVAIKSEPASDTAAGEGSSGTVSVVSKGPNQRKGPNQKRQGMKNGNMRRMHPGMNGFWGPPGPPMFPPMMGGRRYGPFPPPPPHFRLPPMGMRGMRGGPMMPPPPPNGRFGPPMGPGPMGMMPRPMPPVPPMRGGPMMNPMGRMMPPPLRNRPNGGPGGMRRKPGQRGNKQIKEEPGNLPANSTKSIKAPNKKVRTKGSSRLREEHPLSKPWVTDEIKAEHDKKVEIANRLKGKKDDALFAQFKEQRDKFVKMYEAARLEFIGKHPEQDVEKILTEPVAAIKDAKTVNETNDAVSTDTPPAETDSTATTAAAANDNASTTTTTN